MSIKTQGADGAGTKTAGQIAAERVCHEEQMVIWSSEMAERLAMGDWLREHMSYEDKLGFYADLSEGLRDIVDSAFALASPRTDSAERTAEVREALAEVSNAVTAAHHDYMRLGDYEGWNRLNDAEDRLRKLIESHIAALTAATPYGWAYTWADDDCDGGAVEQKFSRAEPDAANPYISGILPLFATALASVSPRADSAEPHFGYLFHNPDTGHEWSESHPIESGEVEDAEDVRPATAQLLHEMLIEAWSELEDARAELYSPAPATPPGVPDSLRALSEDASEFATVHDLEIHDGDDGATVARKFRASLAYAKAAAAAARSFPEGGTAAMRNSAALMNSIAAEGAAISEHLLASAEALFSTHPAGQAGDAGAAEPCAWAGGNDTCYCRTCGEEYRYGREDKPPCPRKPTPDSTRTGAAETESPWPEQYAAHADGYGPVEEWRDWTRQAGRDPLSAGALHALRGMVGEFVSDALAARPEAPSDAGWSFDMETAPRDGTPLLCIEYGAPQKVVDLHWFTDGIMSSWCGSFGQMRRPIAWRHFPAPPSDPAPSGQAEG